MLRRVNVFLLVRKQIRHRVMGAGWLRHPIIADRDALDAVPEESAIRDYTGELYWKDRDGWHTPEDTDFYNDEDIALPAILLYTERHGGRPEYRSRLTF